MASIMIMIMILNGSAGVWRSEAGKRSGTPLLHYSILRFD